MLGAAEAIRTQIGEPLGLDLHEAAAAILRIATERMVSAIEEITIHQGIDPRQAVLVGGGGAAGLQRGRDRAPARMPGGGHPRDGAGAECGGGADLRSGAKLRAHVPHDRHGLRLRGCQRSPRRARGAGAGVHRRTGRGRDQQLDPVLGGGPLSPSGVGARVSAARRPNRRPSSAGSAATRLPRGPPRRVLDRRRRLCNRVRELARAGHLPAARARADDRATTPGEERRRDVYVAGRGLVSVPVWRLDAIPIDQQLTGPAIVETPTTTVMVDDGAVFTRRATGSLHVVPDPGAQGGNERRRGVDGVRMAVISNRFDAVVNSMMNTIFRSGRSGVLNSAHDFSCCVLSAEHQLVMGAESLPIHMMSGPDLIARAVLKVHPELRRGDAYLHNNPYNGNSHPADHAMFVPVIDEHGVHRFSVVAKAHQADCGNSQPTTYMAGATDVYEEGALLFDACRVQTALRRQRGHPADAATAHPRPGAVVGRLPRPARSGPGRRAARARARRRARLGRARDVRRRLVSTTAIA